MPTVPITDMIYIGIEIVGGHAVNLVLQAEKCYATPSMDPNDALQYIFIDNFCGNHEEINLYQTLAVYANGHSSKVRFAIRAFAFRDYTTADIYIHCQVNI